MNSALKYALAVAVGAAIGIALMPKKVEVRTVEVEKTQTEREKHKETTTHEVVKPDGTKETTTTTVEDTSTQRKTEGQKNTESTKTYGGPATGISLLVKSRDFTSPDTGLQVTRNILGPISVGAFGFKSGDFGLSVGLQF